ncbi:MAG: pyruvate dehydrogenase E2 component (dihydrolipoamide acetyltransferase), partial [Haloarculaceae archaeon]
MFEFELPDVGEGVAEGEIVAWHVAPGDTVAEDEVLAEVETDKAVVDLPAPVAGTVVELHAEEGDVVPVGDVVITIDAGEESDEVADEPEAAAEPAQAQQTDESAEESETAETAGGGRVFAPPNVRRLARELDVDLAGVDGSGPGGRVTESDVRATADTDSGSAADAGESDEDGDEPEVKSAVSKATTDSEEATAEGTGRKSAVQKVGSTDGQDGPVEAADRERTLAVPATRKLADEEGVDIDEVPTDKTRDGEAFVEPEDVRAYVEAQEAAAAAESVTTAEATTAATAAASTERERGAPADGETGVATTAEGTDTTEETTEPYRGIRQTIGEQMQESAFTAPHVSHHDKAIVDPLVEAREQLRPKASERDVKLTYLPFVMKAIVAGLKEYPVLNSTLDEAEGEIVYKHYYNIGIAVATDAGLMVPVVENVDEKGLLELAAETHELAERARDRSISPGEMQGGTFSITNFGAIGGEYATPIINYPETAILGLGALDERPVAEDGEVVARHTLPLSLSIDHRIIDGAEGAGFTNTVIEYLENPT